ncbi:MAG TPA: hypothetical protein VKU38_00180 [Ktedonobacteraceae bacterium]|nr:hypothetical protein [Ktedonobacteraceae bacterium]
MSCFRIETISYEARTYLTDVAASSMFEGVPTEILVPFGPPPSTILSAADASQADVVVFNSHG